MSDTPNFMTHERIMSGEEYVSYSDYLLLKEKYDTLAVENMLEVNKLCQERDDARDALMNIDEIFCDGEDMHDDWMKMGNIAKDYFKGLE